MKDIDTEKARKSHPIAGKSEESPASGLSVLTTAHRILNLQRTIGNRAALHLFQPKLKTSLLSDDHETIQRKTKNTSILSSAAHHVERDWQDAPVLSSTAPHIQRAPRNGESTTADVAPEPTAVASGTGALIVDDDAASVGAGQMRKSDFLEQLRSTVCATADEALKDAGQSTKGCPYIEQWLGYYAGQEPSHIERALRKYAPEAAGATSARDYIPAVSNRVRVGVDRWARTGEITGVPPELMGLLSGPGAALGAIAGMIGGALSGIGSTIGGALSAAAGAVGSAFSSIGRALFKRKEGHEGASDGSTSDEDEIKQRLSGGQPLNDVAKSRMGAVFGYDFSGVRVHTGPGAAGLSDSLNARAFTVGTDIAFGPGEYQPGTLIGDALIAHELAHVVQQNGGGNGSTAPQSKGVAGHDALEEEADVAAVSAVSALWVGAPGGLANISRQAMPRLRSGLQLQRCSKKSYPAVPVSSLPAGRIREAVAALSQSDNEIDRNTARQIAEGHIHVYYYEDLKRPSDPIEGLLLGYGIADTENYTIYLHPVTQEDMVVLKRNAEGSRHGNDVFGYRTATLEEWKMLLVHETSHVVNAPVSNLLEKYKTEFRAYWVAQFRVVPDPDERARKIKKHILDDYSDIKKAYDSDRTIKAAIDAYIRPEGDLKNVTGLNVTPRPAGK